MSTATETKRTNTRAIWKGQVSFGLVSIPIKLVSATRQLDVSFHQLHRKNNARIRQQRIDGETGEQVVWEDIIKGFQVSENIWVTVTEEELGALAPKATKTIDIQSFANIGEVDPIYFDKSYFLVADDGGAKAYKLFQLTLASSGFAAIGTFVMRSKEYICALRPYGEAIVLNTLLWPDEILSVPKGVAAEVEPSDAELNMASLLVENLTTHWNPSDYSNTYREKVLALIQAKAEGRAITVEEPESAPTVTDLMSQLAASVEQAKKLSQPVRTVEKEKA